MIKDIPGYENYYCIDTEGNVYSKDRIITQINPKTNKPMTYLKKGRKLRPAIKGNGYYGVCLMVNGIGKYIPIHRLLAITFIPNPNNLPCINHKDENKLNNNIPASEFINFINDIVSFCSTKLCFATSQYDGNRYLIYYTPNTSYSSIVSINTNESNKIVQANDVNSILNMLLNVIKQNIRNVPCTYNIALS